MRYLLIDGPADGERHSLPETMSTYRVAKVRESPTSEMPVVDYVFYSHFRLAAGAELFSVYIHDSLTPAETIRRLIDHYRP